MTRDELLNLPIAQLVDYVIEYQRTVEQLRTRVADLEGRLSEARGQSVVTPRQQAENTVPAASDAPVATHTPDGGYKTIYRHRHRHHRPWYKKLGRSLFPRSRLTPTFLLFVTIIILAAVALGLASAHFGGPLSP